MLNHKHFHKHFKMTSCNIMIIFNTNTILLFSPHHCQCDEAVDGRGYHGLFHGRTHIIYKYSKLIKTNIDFIS